MSKQIITQFKRSGKFDGLRHNLYGKSQTVNSRLIELVEQKISKYLDRDSKWVMNKGKTVGLVTGHLYKDEELDHVIQTVVDEVTVDVLEDIKKQLAEENAGISDNKSSFVGKHEDIESIGESAQEFLKDDMPMSISRDSQQKQEGKQHMSGDEVMRGSDINVRDAIKEKSLKKTDRENDEGEKSSETELVDKGW